MKSHKLILGKKQYGSVEHLLVKVEHLLKMILS